MLNRTWLTVTVLVLLVGLLTRQGGLLIATVLSTPVGLGLPVATWPRDRLVAYLAEQHGVAMQRSRVDELRVAAGSRWRTQEPWFGQWPE